MSDLPADVLQFLSPERLWNRNDVLSHPSPIPAVPGAYGWWFNRLPALLDVSNCRQIDGFTLLYTGISPKRPSTNGRPASKGQLCQRIVTHYAGNAEGSTLRKTLGCLLAGQLGIQLRRVGSGSRRTFVDGERQLSQWMGEHAYVSFAPHERPWELEERLIELLDVPLNLEGNSRNAFHPELTRVRRAAVVAANLLPVVPNPRVGGR